MTKQEFEDYGKRLHGLKEKGFFIQLRPMISGDFDFKPLEEKVEELSVLDKTLIKLFVEGYLKEPKKLILICNELKRHGIKTRASTVYKKLMDMVKSGKLFKEGKEFVERVK